MSKIALALLLAATGIYAFLGAIWQIDDLGRLVEFPTQSQISLVLGVLVLGGAAVAYGWWAAWVLNGRKFSAAFNLQVTSSIARTSLNSCMAVFLAWGALYVLLGLNTYLDGVWTNGGVPRLLISLGWESTSTFFVYDALRFCLFSFIAIWPVTVLEPPKPVLYPLAIAIVLILLFQYWVHVDGWGTLLRPEGWVLWLVIIHVLSIPAMYLLHLKLHGPYNKSFKADAVNSPA